MLLIAPGCRIGGSSGVSAENDRLRAEVVDLSDRIKLLEGERDELKVKVAELAEARAMTMPQEVLEALPRATTISIDGLSGFTPTDPSAPATGVVAYFTPKDGRGRFVQVAGTIKVEALVAAAEIGAGSEPRLVGSVSLNPAQVRDAYRSGLLGTHYTVEFPMQEAVARGPAEGPTLILRAEFMDGLTGQVHRAERLIPGRAPEITPAARQ